MRYLNKLLRLLLTLPSSLRLGITLSCVMLGLITYILTFPIIHNGNLMTLPVALTAWMFKKKGFLLHLSGGALVLFIYLTLRIGTWLWPYTYLFSFASGLFILLLEGLFIITLRELLDSADEARNKAQEAEKRIETAYEQQYQLNQIKDQFLININHELRTPLTELHGYIELLHDRYEYLDNRTQVRYIEHAFQASSELQQVTYNVLDAMQIDEQSKILIGEEFILADQIEDIIKHLNRDKLQKYSIQSNIPAHLMVFANAHAVRQIMHNLLSNVFKYAPPQTRISIYAEQITTQKVGRESVYISVQDEGSGIPPDEIPLLFQQFVRLKRDISGPIRGTGLGLYVCRKLVEAMDGSIWIESDGIPGHGCRFCFTLPTGKHPSKI